MTDASFMGYQTMRVYKMQANTNLKAVEKAMLHFYYRINPSSRA
jgi:hypothetical protein